MCIHMEVPDVLQALLSFTDDIVPRALRDTMHSPDIRMIHPRYDDSCRYE